MGLLGKKDLLKKQELQIERVDLDNDEYVFVREMTGRERDKWEQSMVKEKKDNTGKVIGYDRNLLDFRAKLAAISVCDELGNSILDYDDFIELSKNMSAKRLEKIITAAQKLNNITETDKETLLKNSEADQNDNSISDSQEN